MEWGMFLNAADKTQAKVPSLEEVKGVTGFVRHIDSIAALQVENHRLQELVLRYENALLDQFDCHVENRYVRAIEATGIGIWDWDMDSNARYRSPQIYAFSGYTQDDVPCPIEQLIFPEDSLLCAPLLEDFICGKQEHYTAEFRTRHKDGSYRWLLSRAAALRRPDRTAYRIIGTVTDITERKEAETARLASEERFRAISEASPLGIFVNDRHGNCIYINPTYSAITGTTIEQSLDVRWLDFVHPDDKARLTDDWMEAVESVKTGSPFSYDNTRRNIRPDGTVCWVRVRSAAMYDAAGECTGYVGTLEDVTARKQWEAEQERLLNDAQQRADHDPLTHLLNHGAFHRELAQAVDTASQSHAPFAVALLDTDNFKFFNDAYGHAAGDQVLCQIAHTLQNACRPTDRIGRVGGDEFAVLLPRVTMEQGDAVRFRLKTMLAQQGYRPAGSPTDVPLGLSAGLAFFPEDGTTILELLRIADERLYEDKRDSKRRTAVAATLAETLRMRVTGKVPGFPMLDALVTSVDNKDRYTRRHSEEVMLYAVMIGEVLGLEQNALSSLMLAALVHDIGKIGVSDRVLRLPGSLAHEEYEAVKQHVTLGAAVISAVAGLEHTLPGVRHHHEHWDGTGYPDGLAGEAIPLPARILAVADAFSAMTSDRPYRKRLHDTEALARLRIGAGVQWDAKVVAAFESAWQKRVIGESA